MILRRLIPVILILMLTLTACQNKAEVPDAAATAISEVPALISPEVPETTAAAEPTTEPTVEPTTEPTTEPTEVAEPEPTGQPEMEGSMNVVISLSDKGAPRMDWEEIPNAVVYEIFHSLYPDYGFSSLSSVDKLRYTNASAAKGMTHFYQVRALDADGNPLDTSAVLSIDVALNAWEGKTTKYVAVPKVKLHTHPDSASPEVPLRYMDEVQLGLEVISRDTGSWYRVFYQGELYYLLMSSGSNTLTNVKSPFRYNARTTLQKNVLDLALDICNNWNTTYVPGGTGDVNAEGAYQFDCSGLVSYILNNALQPSIPTYRLSSSMNRMSQTEILYNAGFPGEFRAIEVDPANMQAGDVLFFRSQLDEAISEDLGHCSVYLGNSEFIHCTSVWEDAVCIMPLIGDFKDNLLAVRRFIPDSPTPANTVKVINGPYRNYKIYSEKNSASELVATASQGDALTVLFTNNEDWAYVRTMSNLYGWFRMDHFGTPQT